MPGGVVGIRRQYAQIIKYSGQTRNGLPGIFLYFIPFNFVGFQIQLKAFSVIRIDSGALWFVGIVYHTVFPVLHVGMYFHIEIIGKPFV